MSPKKKSPLENFLFAASNSHAKESLINNNLLFDLKLAAAERGYFLNVYLPEVDQDGFDKGQEIENSSNFIPIQPGYLKRKTRHQGSCTKRFYV